MIAKGTFWKLLDFSTLISGTLFMVMGLVAIWIASLILYGQVQLTTPQVQAVTMFALGFGAVALGGQAVHSIKRR
jgi:uncharacterized membrane protein